MRIAVLIGCLLAVNALGAPLQIRVATYNASLNRSAQGQLATDLSTPANTQAKRVAEIVQRVRPDIVLINEFDVDPAAPTLARDRFHDNYLAIAQNGQLALNYPYRYAAASNTGVSSGKDLDNSGSVTSTPGTPAYGNDSFGFGEYAGKYSFAVYSRFPLVTSGIRAFQLFKWRDMPGAVLPPGWYSPDELDIFRLSSKNHVDLPIEVKPGQILHLLASHPTPPSFDSTEDRNGRRNHDEIRFWADYVSNAAYIRDDAAIQGGLSPSAGEQRFIILGDLNADPHDGDSYLKAINLVRNHPLINAAPNPSSPGGTQQASLQGGKNTTHLGIAAYDTSDFRDDGSSPGNLRVDYILPSKAGFSVANSGVFWPLTSDPAFPLVSASDHRMVWMDLTLLPVLSQAVRDLQTARVPDVVTVTWKTQAGVAYKLEWSTNLVEWFDTPEIPIAYDAAARLATATDTRTTDRMFYRVRVTLEQ